LRGTVTKWEKAVITQTGDISENGFRDGQYSLGKLSASAFSRPTRLNQDGSSTVSRFSEISCIQKWA
jgi:hypothetical protein